MPEVLDYRTGVQHPINVFPDRPSPEPPALETKETRSEPEPEEQAREPREELSESSESQAPSAKESSSGGHKGAQEQNGKEKLSRYERTKRQKEALRQREAQLSQREAQLVEVERARVEAERKAQEPDYTLADLYKYKKQWESEGNFDLADKAEKEIARLEQLEASNRQIVEIPRHGTPQFTNAWHQAEQEIYELDPEFMRADTRLDKTLRTMMSGPDGDIYRQHPRGIVAAYHRAKLMLTESDLAAERTKTQKLEKELQRLNGLLGIGGGGSGRSSGRGFEPRDFAKLSAKDMRQHLVSTMRR